MQDKKKKRKKQSHSFDQNINTHLSQFSNSYTHQQRFYVPLSIKSIIHLVNFEPNPEPNQI